MDTKYSLCDSNMPSGAIQIDPKVFRSDLPVLQSPFNSFWMGGFECSDKMNAFGNRVDLVTASGHLQLLKQDYQQLGQFKMKTVREGIRWSFVEKSPYTYDWTEVQKMMLVGRDCGIQQVWDICHFGFPDDLTPLHPMFARRFAAVSKAFVSLYRSIDPVGTLIVTPINEVSFLSWLGGDVRGTVPYCTKQGWEVKYALMKAYIEGIEAMKQIDPTVRILTTEPLVNIVAPHNASQEQLNAAAALYEDQFQVTEILAGNICPELRGKAEYLDMLGYNYYFNNQWEIGSNAMLHWANDDHDQRFIPLHSLLQAAHNRYACPIVLSETSHPKEDRPRWIEMVTAEALLTVAGGIPLWGICWYPVTDRPDWDHLHIWHQSGLWDGAFEAGHIERILHQPTAAALFKAQQVLG